MGIPFIYPPGAEIMEDLEMFDGTMHIVSVDHEPFEMLVNVFKKRYYIIFGHALQGNYLCVPNRGYSSYLSDSLFDLPRNRDALRQNGIPLPEAGMLAQVVCEMKYYINPRCLRPSDGRSVFPKEVDRSWY